MKQSMWGLRCGYRHSENSGLECVSVTWGFRDVEFLKEHGATNLIDEPVELLNYV